MLKRPTDTYDYEMGSIKTSIEELRCNLTSFHRNVDKNALTAECSMEFKTKDFMLTRWVFGILNIKTLFRLSGVDTGQTVVLSMYLSN